MLMHRAFREGKRVLISRPVNHFELNEQASRSFLFAGGIGVTPLLTMAHRLHGLDKPFEFHYSAPSRDNAAFLDEINAAPWSGHVRLHLSAEGSRANLKALVPPWQDGWHLYTCGAPRYMDAVFDAAQSAGWPEHALHREYFAVPEQPDYQNHHFRLRLALSDRELLVPADQSATDVLSNAGITVETKCSDGICGVCAATYDSHNSDPVEHRDYVLSQADRQRKVILCASRSAVSGGLLVIDL